MSDREIALYARDALNNQDRTVSAYEQAQQDMKADGHTVTQNRKDKVWAALKALAGVAV